MFIIENLAKFIGIPPTWTELILSNGIWGVLVIILGTLLKLFGPSFAKWLQTKRDNTNSVLTSLSNVDSKLSVLITVMTDNKVNTDEIKNDTKTKLTIIDNKLNDLITVTDELSSDAANKLKDDELERFFRAHNSKIMALARSFYRYRCKHNHIAGNEQAVMGRYMRQADQLAGKLHGIWKGIICASNGLPVESYWGINGNYEYSYTFMKQLMIEYFDMQLIAATTSKPGPEYEDLLSMVDRIESALITSFKIWINTGKSWGQQNVENILPEMILNKMISDTELSNLSKNKNLTI